MKGSKFGETTKEELNTQIQDLSHKLTCLKPLDQHIKVFEAALITRGQKVDKATDRIKNGG